MEPVPHNYKHSIRIPVTSNPPLPSLCVTYIDIRMAWDIRQATFFLFSILSVWLRCRAVEEKAVSMCGPQETAVAMTTVTATVTPPACGQSQSTQPSMMGARPSMMRAAPPP